MWLFPGGYSLLHDFSLHSTKSSKVLRILWYILIRFLVTVRSTWCVQWKKGKMAPGCLGYIGDDKLPSYVGNRYDKELEGFWIPIKQPVWWKVSSNVFFPWQVFVTVWGWWSATLSKVAGDAFVACSAMEKDSWDDWREKESVTFKNCRK